VADRDLLVRHVDEGHRLSFLYGLGRRKDAVLSSLRKDPDLLLERDLRAVHECLLSDSSAGGHSRRGSGERPIAGIGAEACERRTPLKVVTRVAELDRFPEPTQGRVTLTELLVHRDRVLDDLDVARGLLESFG